jgi:hypothetical protein
VHLEGGVLEDLKWWETLLVQRHCYAMFLQSSTIRLPHRHELASDNSLVACGATYKEQWWTFNFPECMARCETDIVVKELIVLILAIMVWGSQLARSRILVHCDNEAVNAVMKSGTSKNKIVMPLLCFLVFCCLEKDITVFTDYIRSADNMGPDMLSRQKVEAFRCTFPHMVNHASPVDGFWQDMYVNCLQSFYEPGG